ncbi:hypothetical protein GIB67_030129 [Kingdonia uniflora]|uniref:Pentatricopeptide repeat-containing protein n=1 Tax=Kingdonia uniflora TaxID=39325 RepID=A0A7J7LC42_9MAGN|nr:hypothetical protein GIB67_030129 [Kingdonia uniflora]
MLTPMFIEARVVGSIPIPDNLPTNSSLSVKGRTNKEQHIAQNALVLLDTSCGINDTLNKENAQFALIMDTTPTIANDVFISLRFAPYIDVPVAIAATSIGCAQLGLLEQGQFVHSSMNSVKFPMSVSIGAGLIDMYAKCGCIKMFKKVFSEMPRRDVWAWNVMISSLAMHNLGKEAVSLFKRLIREGLSPTNVTFIGILNACSRAGLANDGRHYFKLMR